MSVPAYIYEGVKIRETGSEEYNVNGKELLRKMELIDPEYIEAADKIPRKKKKPIRWMQWTALAACIALTVFSGIMVIISPNEGAAVKVSPGDTASLFSADGVMVLLFAASILATLAVAALIIKDKRK